MSSLCWERCTPRGADLRLYYSTYFVLATGAAPFARTAAGREWAVTRARRSMAAARERDGSGERNKSLCWFIFAFPFRLRRYIWTGTGIFKSGHCFLGTIAGHVEFQYDAVVHQPVDCGRRGHGVFEDRFPLRERQIGCNQDAALFISLLQAAVRAPHSSLSCLDIAKVVDHDRFILWESLLRAYRVQDHVWLWAVAGPAGATGKVISGVLLDKLMA